LQLKFDPSASSGQDFAAYDLYPNPLPDLFAGSQIVVLGRYREGGSTDVTLTGTVNGQLQTFTFPNQGFASEAAVADPSSTPGAGLQSSIPRLWATRKIGYLLNQIRLQGPEQELIDQIVRLSIRYGIVTQYTSYLVTEPLPLGAAEQDRIAEETFNQMKDAPAAPSYGQDAVEQAAGEGAMRDADWVSAAPTEVANQVRIVGSHTFLRSEGTWIDTAFDPDTMETVQVAFLSDDYFALVAADPQLGAAFALGTSVIAISDGIAYQVVSSAAAQETTQQQDYQIPAETESIATPEAALQGATPIPEAEANPSPTLPAEGVRPTAEADIPSPTSSRIPCMGGMLPLALFPLLGLLSLGKIKRNK
jgi:Ca-activated chloride channel family protein